MRPPPRNEPTRSQQCPIPSLAPRATTTNVSFRLAVSAAPPMAQAAVHFARSSRNTRDSLTLSSPFAVPHPTFNIINATSCLDGGGEFDRLAAAMRGSHVEKDVDLKKAKEQLDGRVAGDRQFIWQTCHDGENRIKQVAAWQWTEHGTEAATTASGPPVTALAAGSPPVLPGLSRLTMIVEVGSELNGHPGIVHGGFTAALFDDLFGWAASAEREARLDVAHASVRVWIHRGCLSHARDRPSCLSPAPTLNPLFILYPRRTRSTGSASLPTSTSTIGDRCWTTAPTRSRCVRSASRSPRRSI